MSNSTACPVCDAEEGWSVLVTTQVGVRLPGDSRAATDERTLREMRACDECGVCYDPVIATGTVDGESGEPPPETATAEVEPLREEVARLSDALAAVAEVQAGMADAIPGIDREDVAEALSRRDLRDDE